MAASSSESWSGPLTDEDTPVTSWGVVRKPPINWQMKDMLEFDVTYAGSKAVKSSDLKLDIHPIFARERFILTDERSDALNQSRRLASKFLELAMPYFASWLPSPNYRRYPSGHEPDPTQDDIDSWRYFPGQVDILEAAEVDIQTARETVLSISQNLMWAESSTVLQGEGGGWGLTCVLYPRPDVGEDGFKDYRPGCISDYDEEFQAQGLDSREMTVLLAKQPIDVLLSAKSSDEAKLTATFHVAVTLFHELAHVFYLASFDTNPPVDGRLSTVEPLVDSQVMAEPGHAATSWIFWGWYPEPNKLDEDNATPEDFRMGLSWMPWCSRSLSKPKWMIAYSMPISYVQRILSQASWDELEGLTAIDDEVVSLLNPNIIPGDHLIKALPMSNYDNELCFFNDAWEEFEKIPVIGGSADGTLAPEIDTVDTPPQSQTSPPANDGTLDQQQRFQDQAGTTAPPVTNSRPTREGLKVTIYYMGVFDERTFTYIPSISPSRKSRIDSSNGPMAKRPKLQLELGDKILTRTFSTQNAFTLFALASHITFTTSIPPELQILRLGGPNGQELDQDTQLDDDVANLAGWDDVCLYRRRPAAPLLENPKRVNFGPSGVLGTAVLGAGGAIGASDTLRGRSDFGLNPYGRSTLLSSISDEYGLGQNLSLAGIFSAPGYAPTPSSFNLPGLRAGASGDFAAQALQKTVEKNIRRTEEYGLRINAIRQDINALQADSIQSNRNASSGASNVARDSRNRKGALGQGVGGVAARVGSESV